MAGSEVRSQVRSLSGHDLAVHLALPERQRRRVVRDLLLDHTRLKVRTLGLEEIPAERPGKAGYRRKH